MGVMAVPRISEHSCPLVDKQKTLGAPSCPFVDTKNGPKSPKTPQKRKNDPLVFLPEQIQKRQQRNGAKSPTKTPTADTKWCKMDPNGAKIKEAPFLPSPTGRRAGGEGNPPIPSPTGTLFVPKCDCPDQPSPPSFSTIACHCTIALWIRFSFGQ